MSSFPLISPFLEDLLHVFDPVDPAGLKIDSVMCRAFAEGLGNAFQAAAAMEAYCRSQGLVSAYDLGATATASERKTMARAAVAAADGNVVALPWVGRARPLNAADEFGGGAA